MAKKTPSRAQAAVAVNVPQPEQDELLGALGAMKTDIVEVQSAATGTELPATFKPAPALSTDSKK